MFSLIISIFLIPLIVLFNSYFLGKIIRKNNISINGYIATTTGFFIFISALFLFFTLLYISRATIIVYLSFFLIIQLAMMALYIWNYRYAFISWKLKPKPLIHFVIIFALTITYLSIIIVYAYHTMPVMVEGLQLDEMGRLFNIFSNEGRFNNYNQIVWFGESNRDFTFQSFSIFAVIAAIFSPLFKISTDHMNEYLFWQQVITFAIIFSCVTTGFFYNRINRSHVSLCFALMPISLLLLLFSFMFYESPLVGDSWISIPIILYCYQMFKRINTDQTYSSNIMAFIIVGISAIDINLTLLTILLLIFHFCYCSLKNLNPIGQLIYLFFPLMYLIFVWVPMSSSIPYIVLLAICSVGALVVFLLYHRGFMKISVGRINGVVSRHPFIIIGFITFIIYLLSIFLLITIFDNLFSWQLWPEILYQHIWGVATTAYNNFSLYLNVISWGILFCILVFCIVLLVTKKVKISNSPYVMLILTMIILFVNPLSLNLFNELNRDGFFTLFDIGLINFLVLVPMLLWFNNYISKAKIFAMEQKGLTNGYQSK